MKNVSLVLCLMVSLMVAGCSTIPQYKTYSGPELPGDRVAKVEIDCQVTAIDGKPVTINTKPTILVMAPGKHTLEYKNIAQFKIIFEAKAGQKYRLDFACPVQMLTQRDPNTGKWKDSFLGNPPEKQEQSWILVYRGGLAL